jgi:hypothetical protein
VDGPVRYTCVGKSLKRDVPVLMNQRALFYSIIVDFAKIKNYLSLFFLNPGRK